MWIKEVLIFENRSQIVRILYPRMENLQRIFQKNQIKSFKQAISILSFLKSFDKVIFLYIKSLSSV